ncbi:ATP-binding protein [Streptomyces sp. SPB162]|uniref:ATP-binding protein n=1 Tax=Streptomyces sp. SPB162 TaxID=2940560 RepID=UPI00240639C5|nr:ATP-binding protein [Streptomyces sp. SPB162]MDF9813206.1 anti-sigma regulatory factor (Ser/Thr protein kinase) [Streptomyces sp. SPB162]
MHDARVLPGPSDPPPRHAPELSECGFYLVIRPDGFVLHMSASAVHLREMRAQVFKEVCGAGAGEGVADAARLVASELVGNAVRLCGPWAPVVVQVAISPDQVLVQVHDPEPAAVPKRRPRPPGNDKSESGRGLWILDLLAPGWTVRPTPVGKQIRCHLPYEGRNCA